MTNDERSAPKPPTLTAEPCELEGAARGALSSWRDAHRSGSHGERDAAAYGTRQSRGRGTGSQVAPVNHCPPSACAVISL